MPTTPGGINYPSSSDSIDIPGDFETLALDVEAFITANAVTTTGTFTLTNKTLTSPIISNPTFTGQASGLEIAVAQNLIFEGTTADDFELTLSAGDPTADRVITLPDATGTLALTSDISITESSTATFSNKSISLATNTVTATLAELNTAISDADVASLAGSETLTNKTLTTPIISSISNTGTITIPTTTGTLALQADVTVASNLVVALEIAVIMGAF